MQYPRYAVLGELFGISIRTVSVLITAALPLLANHFLSYIPENIDSDTTSHLSNNIIAIVDPTIHPTRKPASKQHLWWNGHYKTHGVLTHLLLDFDGFIASITTNVKGHSHDSNASQYNTPFQLILGKKFALGDPGFQGLSWVVPGFKPSHVNTRAEEVFDDISRTEQAPIEHVNNFIKKSATISKLGKFIHGHEKLAACVFIVCGWYNRKREMGYF
jgi:hypothetical protein